MKLLVYRLFKKPFFGRFQRPWRWPEGEPTDKWQPLSIQSASGAKLSALVAHTPRTTVKGAIVLAHPMGAIAKGFWIKYGHADMLLEAGYHVLVFDLNGFGQSTNTNMDYPLDVLAAGQTLQGRYPHLPIGLVGASMGAAMGVCSLMHKGHPFKACVFESAFPTLSHFWKQYPVPHIGVKLSEWLYPKGERKLRPIYAAKNLVGQPNLLLLYGTSDKYTPVNDGKILRDALVPYTSVDFWAVEGADHTHAYAAAQTKYQEKITQFFDQKLAIR